MNATKPASRLVKLNSEIQSRTKLLRNMREVVSLFQKQTLDALKSDLRKPASEAVLTEFSPVLAEINFALENVENWSREHVVSPAGPTLGSFSLLPQPIGKVLVISAWNYPFQLSLLPVVNAIAAGNRVVLKPSEFAPATAQVLKKISEQIDGQNFEVVCGGKDVAQRLVGENFDHIFFTGSQTTGKCILRMAAENLTPVTLELGGKCPCVVDDSIDLDFAARRIVWGKMLNAGQTCIAPDFVLVKRSVSREFEARLTSTIEQWADATQSSGQIVNLKHYDRINSLVRRTGFSLPGSASRQQLHIPLTVLRCDDFACPLLKEEVFGPILPIAEYDELENAIQFISDRPSPLAVYSFSNDDTFHQQLLGSTRSGGFCVNDVILQAVDPAVPFGGVGESGTGRYRGKAGFDCFSNHKTVFTNQECREDTRAYPVVAKRQKAL